MKKSNINYKSSKTLTATETKALSTLLSNDLRIFTSKDISRLLKLEDNKSYQLITNMKKKNWIKEVEQGKYVILSITTQPMAEAFEVATNIVWPSYISFWSAMSFYGFTEQIPRTIFVATTRRKMGVTWNNTKIKFVFMSPKKFFSYVKHENFVIADKEKSLIDSLLYPRYAGGIAEITKCIFSAKDEISLEKLIDYAMKIGNKSLIKRLGYLLDFLKIKIPSDLRSRIRQNIGRGYSLLDSTRPKTKCYDRKWMLILNVSKKEMIEWRRVY